MESDLPILRTSNQHLVSTEREKLQNRHTKANCVSYSSNGVTQKPTPHLQNKILTSLKNAQLTTGDGQGISKWGGGGEAERPCSVLNPGRKGGGGEIPPIEQGFVHQHTQVRLRARSLVIQQSNFHGNCTVTVTVWKQLYTQTTIPCSSQPTNQPINPRCPHMCYHTLTEKIFPVCPVGIVATALRWCGSHRMAEVSSEPEASKLIDGKKRER